MDSSSSRMVRHKNKGPRTSSPTLDGEVLSPEFESIITSQRTKRRKLDIQFQLDEDSTPERELRFKKLRQSENAFHYQLVTNPVSNENPTQKALRMAEILEAIFARVPTASLLSSCSLVNAFWNTEARIFIRDHRICTFSYRWGSECDKLQILDKICGDIGATGRVIPFNRIVVTDCKVGSLDTCCLDVSNSNGGQSSNNNEILLSNLTSKFKLKYIEIRWNCRGYSYHKPLATLLTQKCCQLRSLRIEGTHLFANLKTKEWHPQLPRLEELSIAEVPFQDGTEETHKIALRWLLKDAPNFKKITVANLGLLRIVPDELLSGVELQDKMDILLTKREDIQLLIKISETRPCLNHIRIYEPRFHPEDPSAFANLNLHATFYHELGRVLQNYHQSLTKVEIVGACPLGRLSHSPLSNLLMLTIWGGNKGTLDELWNVIASIDFERAMPRLNQVKIDIGTITQDALDTDLLNEWPVASNRNVLNRSPSVRVLDLHLKIQKINLRPLKALFPNIAALHIHLSGRWGDCTRDFAPLGAIWECWPQLEELKFFGTWNYLNRNYDLDFCGIHEEERKLLEQKGKKYLQNVHIVPIKPCVLTMPNLRKLWFEDSPFCFFNQPPGQHETFITDLTYGLAFHKMPGLDLALPRNP